MDKKNKDSFTKAAQKTMEDSAGIPLGIQISTLPYQDEELIGVMKIFEELFPNNLVPLMEPKPKKKRPGWA